MTEHEQLKQQQLEREQVKATKARRHFMTVWTMVGAILLTAVSVYLLNVLSVPVAILIWTVIIVFCLRGPVNKLEKMGLNRAMGTTIAYLLMFAVLALVGLLLFSPAFGLGDQFANLIQSIPSYVQTLTGWGNELYARYADFLQNDTVKQWMEDALKSLADWASAIAREGATGVVALGSTVFSGFMAIGFALVVAFWVLMELPSVGRECRRLVSPRRQQDMEMLHFTLTRVMGGYIKGTLFQCAIIGVASGVLFGVIGIPNYAALGGISGLLNIIPIIGPWLGGALAAIVGVFVNPLVAIIALVGSIAIQQIVYTFISPRIMASSVDVHPALTILALMVGSAIGGAMGGLMGSLVGMLASIPATAVAKSVFVYYFEKNTGRTIVAEDGVFFKGTGSWREQLSAESAETTGDAGAAESTEAAEAHETLASSEGLPVSENHEQKKEDVEKKAHSDEKR